MAFRTYLVEDNPVIRDNLIPTLEDLVDAHVLGHAESEAQATAWLDAHAHEWQIAVVDMFLRQGSGLGVLRHCQQHLGMSFNEWRLRLRVVSALGMLDAGRPVQAVARELGYSTPSAFIAMFQRLTGESPDNARRRSQGGAPAP